MSDPNPEEGWTLQKGRPGKRTPTVATTNPYDSLRYSDTEDMPVPVQTPKPTIPVTTDKEPTTAKTAPTPSKNITVVDYSFLDTMTESSATKTIMDYVYKKVLTRLTLFKALLLKFNA